MADPTPHLRHGESNGETTHAPRWAKVLGAIAAVLVLLFVIVMVTGGPGAHGPSRHTGGDGGDRERAPSSAPKEHMPPPGADHR
jgi:hypothetical protein